MAGSREIRITILGDDKSGSAALKTLGSTADTTEVKIGGLGKSLGVLGTAGAVALGSLVSGVVTGGIQALGTALVGMVGDAQESALVAAQLAAVLKSTGGAAGVTAEDVDDLSNSLSALTGIDDEAITSAQSVLLTFTNIGKDVFPDTTQAVLDLSVALGQDFQSSAVQVGKALNDPIQGITALTRVGVTFTDQQKDQIAAMVEVGNVAGAQKIILAELAKEFGGSAEAQATNVKKLTVAWGNFKESIGGALLPAIEKVAGALNTMLRSDTFQTAITNITGGITRLVSALDDPAVQTQLTEWKDAAVEFGTSFNAALNDVETIALPALRNLGIELDIVKRAFAEPIVSVLWAGSIQQLSDLNQLLEYYIILTGGTLPNALTISQNASDGLGTSIGQTVTEVNAATIAAAGLATQAGVMEDRLERGAGAASRMGTGLAGAAGAIGAAMPSVTDMGHGLHQLALGADAAASATDRATAAYNTHVQAIQGLNTEQSALQALLTPLQAEWDALNIATNNGANATDAQKAAYARLAPSIEYLNGQIGVNKSNTVDATIAAVNQKRAIDDTTTAATLEGIAQAGAGVASTLAAAVKSSAAQTSKQAVDDEAGAVGLLKGAIERVPTSLSTSFTAPGLDQGITDIGGNLVNAIGNVPRSFTVTAHVDISGALASLNTLNNNLPHSPAKEGPFSTLPNWHAIFDMEPAVLDAINTVTDLFGFMAAGGATGLLGGLPAILAGGALPGAVGGHIGAPIPGVNPVTGQPYAAQEYASSNVGGWRPSVPATTGGGGAAPIIAAGTASGNAGVEARLDTIISLIRDYAARAGNGAGLMAIAETVAGIFVNAAGSVGNEPVAAPSAGWR